MSAPIESLRRSVELETIQELSDVSFMNAVAAIFINEIECLKRVTWASERGDNQSPVQGTLVKGASDKVIILVDLTPSKFLFDEDYPDVNRTLTNILAVKWVLANDYAAFTQSHQEPVKLSRDTFDKLRTMTLDILKTPDHTIALIVSLILGDMGKDNKLIADLMQAELGGTIEDWSAFRELAKKYKAMTHDKSFIWRSPMAYVLAGMKLDADLNIPQLIQGESVALCLKSLFMLSGKPQAYALKYLETLFDVASASGHIDARGSISMTEPVCQSFLIAYPILQRIVEKGRSTGVDCLSDAYNAVLRHRSQILTDLGSEKRFRMEQPSDRAFLHLCAMGRVTSTTRAAIFLQAFNNLPESTRRHLIAALNVDGLGSQVPAVLSYIPALFAEVLRFAPGEPLKQVKAINSLMAFMSRMYQGNSAEDIPEGRYQQLDLRVVLILVQSKPDTDPSVMLDDARLLRSCPN
ncbi:hypothetical protein BO94DRAFT_605374 [Aspergillus sclerotioniger CBS 115572]|uniref:Uncharacterized protein n=1 Tax=Aspergillus sclerotioniger CBS 115572 TaxID=1450535 RepID=A0A317VTC9_9EURO|nr:hypothetical protein BO94DRAFT_605374 [Aspergillus sclerotioniger CBS 115572]PWY76098.1 hypothetical protein BO94DRAFT_605374 [Aspergillus sclerotioniger CBS 115572]